MEDDSINTKRRIIKPIKRKSNRIKFKKYWYKYSNVGPRNWMMFRLGIVTALRASDICKLKLKDVYNANNTPRDHIYSKDIKTRKPNNSYITPLKRDLVKYRDWLNKKNIQSPYLFPALGHTNHPVQPHYLYLIMKNAANKLKIPYVGSHSLRKTFGYIAYKRTHNLAYVMEMLNHSNPKVTLRYIGVEQEAMDHITRKLFK